MRSIRTQIDDKGDEVSRATILDCSASRDMARQEFKDDADINVILSRFGLSTTNRTPTYGEIDYTLDLQTALGAIAQSQSAYRRLSPELKAKYPTWQKLVNAMASGHLAKDLDELGKKYSDDNKPAPPPEPDKTPNKQP